MIQPVTLDSLHFIEGVEGVRLKAYWDSKGKVWTIGPGMTMIYGRPVRPTDVLTTEQNDQLFRSLTQYYLDHVLAVIKPEIRAKLTQNQITALLSLAWNIGLGGGKVPGFTNSLVLQKLNAGDFKDAADAFMNWTRSGDDPTLLKERRDKERSLFLSCTPS